MRNTCSVQIAPLPQKGKFREAARRELIRGFQAQTRNHAADQAARHDPLISSRGPGVREAIRVLDS